MKSQPHDYLMGPLLDKFNFEDPCLDPEAGSEIAAAVDVAVHGMDSIFRPVYINQDDQILALTPEDAKRLLAFLQKAVKFLDEYQTRIEQ